MLLMSVMSDIKEEEGHLTGGKAVTGSGLQSLIVDRALSSPPPKGKQVGVSSSTQAFETIQESKPMSIELKSQWG